MRETGKTKKIKGYREEVTYGLHPYTVPITDARGVTKPVRFVATLREMVPDHTPCNMCGLFLSTMETEMAPHMISCEHIKCRETKINELTITFDCDDCGGHWEAKSNEPYWTPLKDQEFICFECYEQMLDNEQGFE
jgi:hypothetical protein